VTLEWKTGGTRSLPPACGGRFPVFRPCCPPAYLSRLSPRRLACGPRSPCPATCPRLRTRFLDQPFSIQVCGMDVSHFARHARGRMIPSLITPPAIAHDRRTTACRRVARLYAYVSQPRHTVPAASSGLWDTSDGFGPASGMRAPGHAEETRMCGGSSPYRPTASLMTDSMPAAGQTLRRARSRGPFKRHRHSNSVTRRLGKFRGICMDSEWASQPTSQPHCRTWLEPG
jgi:hypothetical protein